MRHTHETHQMEGAGRSIARAVLRVLILPTLLLVLAGAARAQGPVRFTVNSTDDADDGVCDATHCSLREAIDAANAGAGIDTIAFDFAGAGLQTITPAAPLPDVTDPVVIDGATEPDFASVPVIELRGDVAGAGASGLHILAGGSTVRGLIVNRFTTGIHLEGAGSNRVEGNYIGSDDKLIKCLANTSAGILIDSSDNVVGGTTFAARNIIGCSGAHGVHITGGSGNRVESNYVGVDLTGTQPLPNAGDGVRIEGSTDNTVGGTGQATANVIVGNGGAGVLIGGPGSTGNLVGRNTIYENGGAGVALPDAGAGNPVRANSMPGNQGLGIDLGASGVTANDAGDLDSGPNELQNHPVITGAYGNAAVVGSIATRPGADYDIEIFTGDECDPTGHGEGAAFAAEGQVTTDGGGQASFTLSIAGGLTVDGYVTATATDAAGNTSEFSECARVQDFELAVLPDSVVVGQGQDANYAIDIAPSGASFDAGVQLACSNLPPETSCSFSIPTVTPGTEPVRSIMTIATTAPSPAEASGSRGFAAGPGAADALSTALAEGDPFIGTSPISYRLAPTAGQRPSTGRRRPPSADRAAPAVTGLLLLAALGIVVIAAPVRRRTPAPRPRPGRRAALAGVLLGLALFAGCGDDDEPMTPLVGGTPPGRYAVTVSATSGPLTHSTATIIVVRG